jgi:hypothetical protein
MIGKVVHLTNSDAPEKRPEVATPEGRAVVTRYLDQIAAEFMGTIAKGRGVLPAAVAAGYGRGSSMLAGPAKAAGLIDEIAARASVGARTDLTYARTAASVPICMSNLAAEETPDAKPAEPTPAEPAPVEPKPEPAPAPAEPAPNASAAPAAADAPRLITAAEFTEFAALRAERAERLTAERRALVTELVALGAETPATAWVAGAMAPRLASEDLASMRERVAALRAAKPATPLQPPAVAEFAGLSEVEAETAAKIKDPELRARFIARRRERATSRK